MNRLRYEARLLILLMLAGGQLAIARTVFAQVLPDEAPLVDQPITVKPVASATGDASLLPTEIAAAPSTAEQPQSAPGYPQPAAAIHLERESPPTLQLGQPETSAPGFAQAETTLTTITNVRLEATDTGLQVILETAAGELPVPTSTVTNNALIAELENTVLALPDSDEFLAFEPATDIALVQVSALPGNRVQVAITGVDAAPTAEFVSTATGLTLSVLPGIASVVETDDALRVAVTGADDRDYTEPNATTGTRTDTPLIDIPQSIQVIPETVLEDQQVVRLNEALRNAPGVVQGNTFGGSSEQFVIRGFAGAAILQDGFRLDDTVTNGFRETANLEQIEVLRGPASILFGNVEPGGVINLVTKQPLATPAAELATQFGSEGFVRPRLDVTGPLNQSGTVRYRLNTVYERAEGFRDFETDTNRLFFAPVVAVDLGDRTDLILDFQYLNDQRPFDRGIPPLGDSIPDVPRDTITGEPTDFARVQNTGVGYRLEHRFSDQWQLRNRFRYGEVNFRNRRTELSELLGGLNPVTGDIARAIVFNESSLQSYEAQTELIGEFSTGSINHTLLMGLDLFFADADIFVATEPTLPVNLFNPRIGRAPVPDLPLAFTTGDSTSSLSRVGLLVQDQIELLPELNLLLGGRVDFFSQSSTSAAIVIPGIVNNPASEGDQSQTAFSPRVGIVYQPIEELALYASYSRAFQPNTLTSTTINGDFLDPEESEQFEVGVKADLLEGRLSATLSFFDISQTNVAAADPTNANFVVPIGEQTSQGMELNVTGEILPGWNVIAGLSLLDAEIADSPDFPDGATPPNVPDTSASLWTTYEIQSGDLAGLGFGVGLFYVGERQGDEGNSFKLDDYLRTDAALYYRRDDVRLGLNFRNLFDIRYFENGGLARRGATVGEPFTVVGSVSISF
ncbi:MAG: TonB-dependent siderophore receptor [Leptolyngbya sp. SIOISBB]|nr:TonB-dependent siderophore receptor [Leptolyngbya sp. SIOISBB]